MRKHLFIWLIIFMFISTSTYAFELDYGLSYNNLVYYQYRDGELNDDYFMREDLNEGIGLYSEILYQIKDFSLGTGINKISADWTGRNEYGVRLVGPYLKAGYNLGPDFKLNTSLG